MEQAKKRDVSVSSLYYAHGLNCASYPAAVIIFVAVVVVLCSLPFFFTTSGDPNFPKPWRSPWLNYRLESPTSTSGTPGNPHSESEWTVNNASRFSVRTPSWFLGLPVMLVQQLLIHGEVQCHQHQGLCQRSYYSLSKTTTVLVLDKLKEAASVCGPVLHPAFASLAGLHVNEDTPPPSFVTSVLSPVLDSVHSPNDQLLIAHSNLSVQTMKELLYGGFWESGHLQHQLRQKEHGNQEHMFSITIVLRPTVDNFHMVSQCVDRLNQLWPHNPDHTPFMKHFFYESEWSLRDFAPLLSLYSIVFLYISFSVGKIDLVRSKLGLGFTSVVTVVCSLSMSLGVCTIFGLSITVTGSEIYPFVVVVIGLENILIIVRAVISSDPGLDVKFRVAEGLSREGMALTKNLCTELFLLAMGIICFNYAMKEFCIIALVSLLCDYFLQVVFFTTVLSIDLRRMELSDLKSTTRISSINKVAGQQQPAKSQRLISKRDRVNNFLVRGRFAQKALMVVVVAYLCAVFSQTAMFHSLVNWTTQTPPATTSPHPQKQTADPVFEPPPPHYESQGNFSQFVTSVMDKEERERVVMYRSGEDGFSLKCGTDVYCWRPLVTDHWPRLLAFHNVTLANKFISVLPPIMLNYRLGFTAQQLFAQSSNPAAFLDSLVNSFVVFLSVPNVARSLFLLVVSGMLTVYIAMLYASAVQRGRDSQHRRPSQTLMRVHSFKHHKQDIECLAASGDHVVTASLDGLLIVWNTVGEAKGSNQRRGCSLVIDRRELAEWRQQELADRHVEGCEAPELLSPVPGGTPSLQVKPGVVPNHDQSSSKGGAVHASGGGHRRSSMPSMSRGPKAQFDQHSLRSVGSHNSAGSHHSADDPTPESPLAQGGSDSAYQYSPVTPQTEIVVSSFKGSSNAQFVKGNASTLYPTGGVQETVSLGSRHSADSVSNNSVSGWSMSSFDTANEAETLAQPSGFDYRSHFSLFSPYTSKLALEYCPALGGDVETCLVPPVWCLDYWNGTVAIGCGNGQIEVWTNTGLLKFSHCSNLPGVTVLCIHLLGILTGHLDGSLHLIGHLGHLTHSVSAHSKPISVMKCSSDYVITGGYDSVVKVHTIKDFMIVHRLLYHKGHVTSLALAQNNHCVSGCSLGLVCYWNVRSGHVIHELEVEVERSGVGVVKVNCSESYVVALLADSSVSVWDRMKGTLTNVIRMGGYTHDIAFLSDSHIALALLSSIVVYDIASRSEVSRKQLEVSPAATLVRHLTVLDPSMLACSTARQLQLVPTGLKPKME